MLTWKMIVHLSHRLLRHRLLRHRISRHRLLRHRLSRHRLSRHRISLNQFAYWAVINVKSFSISRHHENLSPVSYTGSSHTGSSDTVSVSKHANEFRLSYMTFAIGLGATCLLGAITLLGGANDAHFLVECPFLPHLPHGGTVGHSYTTWPSFWQ